MRHYTNLPPRHYRFRVQAANENGVWNETGATVAFAIKPPFYRTIWFLGLGFVLLLAGVVFVRLMRCVFVRSALEVRCDTCRAHADCARDT